MASRQKRFTSKGRGRTYARKVGAKAKTRAIEAELNQARYEKADLLRKVSESQERWEYHRLRMAYQNQRF